MKITIIYENMCQFTFVSEKFFLIYEWLDSNEVIFMGKQIS